MENEEKKRGKFWFILQGLITVDEVRDIGSKIFESIQRRYTRDKFITNEIRYG